jgi:hypothetical protein
MDGVANRGTRASVDEVDGTAKVDNGNRTCSF